MVINGWQINNTKIEYILKKTASYVKRFFFGKHNCKIHGNYRW